MHFRNYANIHDILLQPNVYMGAYFNYKKRADT